MSLVHVLKVGDSIIIDGVSYIVEDIPADYCQCVGLHLPIREVT